MGEQHGCERPNRSSGRSASGAGSEATRWQRTKSGRVSRMRRTPLQGRNACVTRVTRKVTQGLSAAGTAQLNVVAGPSAQQDSGAQRTNSPADEEAPPDKKPLLP